MLLAALQVATVADCCRCRRHYQGCKPWFSMVVVMAVGEGRPPDRQANNKLSGVPPHQHQTAIN